MAKFWQLTEGRAFETQGVWALADVFAVGGDSLATHAGLLAALQPAAVADEAAKDLLATAEGLLRAEYVGFRILNVAIAARFDSEVPDEDALKPEIRQIRKVTRSRAANEDRTLKTISLWKKINTARAAALPAQPEITVRGTTVAAYEARWTALPDKRRTCEERAGEWRTSNSALRAANRTLDRLNKDWYQAWASEFPPGTPEGDALAGVTTEATTAAPQVLEIAAITPEGFFLRISYVPGSGKHATSRSLDHRVVGVHEDFLSAPANPATGDLIGPFMPGQVVRLRTRVGNSRKSSLPGPQQEITIAGPAA